MRFYFGYRQDFGASYHDPRKYTFSIVDPEITTNLRYDDCAVYGIVNHDLIVGFKNRYGSDEYIVLPYRISNQWKHITITQTNACNMPGLISWLIDANIDLNNISELDEFTMMMII